MKIILLCNNKKHQENYNYEYDFCAQDDNDI